MDVLAFGEEVTNGLSGMAPLANLTVVGALIVLVIWMMTRSFPNLIDRHDQVLERKDKEVAAERSAFMDALACERKHRDEVRKEHLGTLHEISVSNQQVHREASAEMRQTRDVLLRLEEKLEI
jgi:hypothetical protein